MTKTRTISSVLTSARNYFEGYILENPCPHRPIAVLLITKMVNVNSIGELSELFEQTEQSKGPALFFNQTSPHDPFITQFSRYQKIIKNLLEAATTVEKTCDRLDRISTTEQTGDLIYLLKKTLKDPRCFLYEKTLSLLYQLQNAELVQAMVDHLAKQPQKPRPQNPHPGSFDETDPLDDPHRTCLDLLRNNQESAAHDSTNGLYANGLLQSLLAIYQAIHAPVKASPTKTAKEADEADEADEASQGVDSAYSCIIL